MSTLKSPGFISTHVGTLRCEFPNPADGRECHAVWNNVQHTLVVIDNETGEDFHHFSPVETMQKATMVLFKLGVDSDTRSLWTPAFPHAQTPRYVRPPREVARHVPLRAIDPAVTPQDR